MTKKNLIQLGISLSLLMLFIIGCEVNQTKSNSGSNSGTTTQEQPPHEQVTYSILEKSPFNGRQLNPTFWRDLEAYCKAGPTQLIISDMNLIPQKMEEAGFYGGDTIKWYALSRTVGGADWSPLDNPEAIFLKNLEGEIDAWWSRYIQAIVQIMQKAPKTTAVIIINDAVDHCGRSLGNGTYKQMTAVIDRVSVGNTVPD
jgi:hypothetical protein